MTRALANVVDGEKLDHLSDEIKATFTERIYNAREEVIRAHWETGKLMTEFLKSNSHVKMTALVQLLADRGAGKERTLYHCSKFYKTFPRYSDTDKLGFGKNLSWNKIKAYIDPPDEKTPERRVVSFEVSKEVWDAVRMENPREGEKISIEALDATVEILIKDV